MKKNKYRYLAASLLFILLTACVPAQVTAPSTQPAGGEVLSATPTAQPEAATQAQPTIPSTAVLTQPAQETQTMTQTATQSAAQTATQTSPPPRLSITQQLPTPFFQKVPTTQAPAAQAEAPQSLVQQAVSDLAKQLGVPESDIEVVSSETVTWNDGSLGCPQPGMFYTQSLVPGYKITLRYQGRVYDYHSDTKRVFLCQSPLGLPKKP